MPSLKLVLLSTGVLSAAIMLRFSAPAISECVPSIYAGFVSWLSPPYLYLLINCIIAAVFASSTLQSGKDDDVSLSTSGFSGSFFPMSDYGYEKTEKELEVGIDMREGSSPPVIVSGAGEGGAFAKDATSNKENEHLFRKSSSTNFVPENRGLSENSPIIVKPTASARIGNRRIAKAGPEGVRTVLGVLSKPNKQDSLERNNNHKPEKKMKKAETFDERTNTRSPDGGGKLGQDELTRRVEAFIKKFNEDMRMQNK